MVIPPKFRQAKPFSAGLAAVQSIEDNLWGYIKTSGEYVLGPSFTEVATFSEGLAAVEMDGWGLGYIDTSGNFITERNPYIRMDDFKHGVAVVSIYQGQFEGTYHAIIDKTGAYVLDPGPYMLGEFSEGMAVYVPKGGLWGYVDTNGLVVIEPQFQQAYLFSEGLAKVKVGNRWGYIDNSGNLIIQPRFLEARNFSNGIAAVQLESEEWVDIDATGTVIGTGN